MRANLVYGFWPKEESNDRRRRSAAIVDSCLLNSKRSEEVVGPEHPVGNNVAFTTEDKLPTPVLRGGRENGEQGGFQRLKRLGTYILAKRVLASQAHTGGHSDRPSNAGLL